MKIFRLCYMRHVIAHTPKLLLVYYKKHASITLFVFRCAINVSHTLIRMQVSGNNITQEC